MRCQHGDRLNTKDANPSSLHNNNDYYDGSRKSYQDDNKTAGSGSVDGPSASSTPVVADTAKTK